MAFGWIGFTTSLALVVRKAKSSCSPGLGVRFDPRVLPIGVNRQAILTPYRHLKMTPLERSGSWPDAV